jgi:hypothetical protein
VSLTRPVGHGNRVSESDPPSKRRWWLAATIVLVSAALVGGLALAFPKEFKHQLEISVVRQPTPYTQLFFSDPSALPQRLHVKRVNTFAITIINDQGRSELYHYTVTMAGAGSRKVVGTGSVVIGDSSSATRTIGVKPKSRKSRYLVTVVLSGDGISEFIQFYGVTS